MSGTRRTGATSVHARFARNALPSQLATEQKIAQLQAEESLSLQQEQSKSTHHPQRSVTRPSELPWPSQLSGAQELSWLQLEQSIRFQRDQPTSTPQSQRSSIWPPELPWPSQLPVIGRSSHTNDCAQDILHHPGVSTTPDAPLTQRLAGDSETVDPQQLLLREPFNGESRVGQKTDVASIKVPKDRKARDRRNSFAYRERIAKLPYDSEKRVALRRRVRERKALQRARESARGTVESGARTEPEDDEECGDEPEDSGPSEEDDDPQDSVKPACNSS